MEGLLELGFEVARVWFEVAEKVKGGKVPSILRLKEGMEVFEGVLVWEVNEEKEEWVVVELSPRLDGLNKGTKVGFCCLLKGMGLVLVLFDFLE